MEGLAAVVTRSQRGHIVRLEAEVAVDGPTFMALSSSTSLWSLWFCSVKEPNHLLKYSHSISVCFNLLLNQAKPKCTVRVNYLFVNILNRKQWSNMLVDDANIYILKVYNNATKIRKRMKGQMSCVKGQRGIRKITRWLIYLIY